MKSKNCITVVGVKEYISIVCFYDLACYGMFLTGYVVLVNVKLS